MLLMIGWIERMKSNNVFIAVVRVKLTMSIDLDVLKNVYRPRFIKKISGSG